MANVQPVTGWLDSALPASVLDSAMRAEGFSLREGTLCYVRQLPEIVQELRIVFDRSPRYEPSAVAHVLPQVVFESSTLGRIVREMTGNDRSLVPGDANLMLRHQLQNLAPKGAHRQNGDSWFIHGAMDTPSVVAQIGSFAQSWGLPFLNRYQDIESITQGHEADDEALRLDRRFFLYVAAAYVHLGRAEKAIHVLETTFGRPAIRKQYVHAFKYVNEQGNK